MEERDDSQNFDSQRMIERAYLHDEIKARASSIIFKALGDLSPACPHCGSICDEHASKLRDAFFRRAHVLADKLCVGLEIYKDEREFGLPEPVDTINAIYRIWGELACLYDLVEPDAAAVEGEDEEETPEE